GLTAEGDAADLGAGERLDDLQRAGLVVEEVVIGPEEIAEAILGVEPAHLLGDAPGALDAVLALVVGGDRAVLAGELAAEREDERADRAEPPDARGGDGLPGERRPPGA